MFKNLFITLLVMLPLDIIWLFLMKNTYDKWLVNFERVVNWPAVLLVYIFIPLGLFWLVISRHIDNGPTTKALIDAFVYGVCAYAVYDLTNLATLKGWSVQMTIVDIIWGGILCLTTAYFALTIIQKIS
ncbi:MAG: DUF2177 family protein [bacterium]|nr:MAG: DUF2177 family protein [bacterium]